MIENKQENIASTTAVSAQAKQHTRAKKIIITLSVLSALMLLVLGSVATVMFIRSTSAKRVLQTEPIFSVYTDGVEGQVQLEMLVNTWEWEEQWPPIQNIDDILLYIDGLTFSFAGQQVPVQSDDKALIVDVKAGDVINIMIEDPQKLGEKLGISLTTFEIQEQVDYLNQPITSITAIRRNTMEDHREYLLKWGNSDDKIMKQIEQGAYAMTFYKIEDTYNMNLRQSGETSALTIFYGFQYEGKIYFLGATNITKDSYGDEIEGQMIEDKTLDLIGDERKVENIVTEMEKRGYTLM